MADTLGLGVTTAFVIMGLWMITRPDSILRIDPDFLHNTTWDRARRNVRIGGVVLLLLALAGLYAIVFEKGPVDPVGF